VDDEQADRFGDLPDTFLPEATRDGIHSHVLGGY
jgi:hypothetical protein